MNKKPKSRAWKGAVAGGTAILLVVLLLITTLSGVSGSGGSATVSLGNGSVSDAFSVVSVPDEANPDVVGGDAEIYFFDVGQGDSSLIIEGGKTLLIDAGDNGREDFLIENIAALGIVRLDYVVATHNHADHIGGMEEIINAFEIGTFFTTATPNTTATYERMLEALEAKTDIEVVIPRPGDSYTLGSSHFQFLGPFNSHLEFDDQNDSSLVLKYINGVHSFLFMGDAEAKTEQDLLDSATDVSATVLKVGHHGSSSSSTPEFIERVGAGYAIISCGADNEYGHPHHETLETLTNTAVLTTPENGTIYVTSTTAGLTMYTEKGASLVIGEDFK